MVSLQRLYHRQGAGRPPRVRWTLEEAGASYEYVVMDEAEGHGPEHAERHPLGRVPVLETDDGLLFESAALCLHIADSNPEANLIAPLGTRERAQTYQWVFFTMTELERTMVSWGTARHRKDEEAVAAGRTRMAKVAAALEEELGRQRVHRRRAVHRRRHRARRRAPQRTPVRPLPGLAGSARLPGAARRAPGEAARVLLMPLDLIEFPADDLARATRFWEGLLDLSLDERTAAEGSGRQSHGDGAALGVHERGAGPGDRFSLPYFRVEDIAAAQARVVELGGSIVHPGERFAICRDSEGSPFGLSGA